LKNPLRIPSLGMDDELIVIRDVKELHMQEMENSRVDSIFILEEGMQFSPKFTTTKGMQFFPPRIVTTNLDFNENEIPRNLGNLFNW